MTTLPSSFRHIRLELARERGHPVGDPTHGYDLVAPLADDGTLDAETFRAHKAECRVRRFRPGEADAVGRLARRPGGQWFFDYEAGEEDDETGFRLGEERFVVGEYVSIREDDDVMHTFQVITVERP
ncbi:hypothetical protein [Prosthecomicrobium pneumaticum]|uniref:Uncharacterized protein n=1 Tax=Prosthecomicrobium pneumaticum TaxID=81895 RepID=A0A7W9CT49_9HYPH|nr:hypothetical protein [Prosthecomicrobium pneumaticum]MBB5751171.1 hypothetical protein [Prosthecomicrobium pneumaticum]